MKLTIILEFELINQKRLSLIQDLMFIFEKLYPSITSNERG